MSIKVLSPELVRQIAAGEVVERPMSVVKELVENALDAGAKNIDLEIENGGINLIRVADDGGGMDKADAEMAILEHATSKISSTDDLFSIKTLGFRGEALSSIASVSKFTLITKNKNSLAGTKISVADGQTFVQETGGADGTSVEARDLFYNVPARQKYLKTAATEFNHIVDLFLSFCLGFPNIGWKLVHNRKTIYRFPAANLKQRINDVLGEEVADYLIPVEAQLNGIKLAGFIAKPQIARNNRRLQYLFINQRPVNEFVIAKQIKEAYGQLLSKESYPVYILEMSIELDKIDVNVHPRKLEVRFSEPNLVYRTIYQLIARILDEQNLKIQAVGFLAGGGGTAFGPQSAGAPVAVKSVLDSEKYRVPVFIKSAGRANVSLKESAKAVEVQSEWIQIAELEQPAQKTILEPPAAAVKFKILGQVDFSYIVAEDEKGMKIYDQHAASERVQYEKIKRQWEIGALASQRLLVPQNIELTPAEARTVNDNFDLFSRFGFEIAAFSANTFAIASVPQALSGKDLREIVLEIIGELAEAVTIEDKLSEPVERVLKMMACRSAIKFGDALNMEGMEALLRDLESAAIKTSCVHGRPCVVEFSCEELKKMFKRS